MLDTILLDTRDLNFATITGGRHYEDSVVNR